MPVRNPDPALFVAAVRSVLDQDWSNLELIVVETPGGKPLDEVIAGIQDRRLRHHVAPEGITTSMARNLAIEQASGGFLAMLDADDLCKQGRIEKQHAWLVEHPEIGVLGTQIEIIDEHDEVLGRRSYPLEPDAIFETMRLYNPIAQPSVMLRRSVIAQHGGYDERPDCTCEDYDLWSRLARKGVRFANLDEVLTSYRMHSGTMKSQRMRESLVDTLRIKRTYWADCFDFRARIRYGLEKILLLLPKSLVIRLFKRLYVKGA